MPVRVRLRGLRRLVVSVLYPDGLIELSSLPAIGGGFRIGCCERGLGGLGGY